MYSLFGLADEFANYVAVALKRNERNDIICQLIKKSQGLGADTIPEFFRGTRRANARVAAF